MIYHALCRRCFITPAAHIEGRGCGDYAKASRLRTWLHLHSIPRHIAGWAWLHTPERARWQVIRLMDRPGRCWCDLVDSWWQAGRDFRADYTGEWGCLCDVPLPTDAGTPRPGECYCAPTKAVAA